MSKEKQKTSAPGGTSRRVLKSEAGEAGFVECLCSYAKEVLPPLAFKRHLPTQLTTLKD